MPSWADLCDDLLESLYDICTMPDQIRMQSVCKSWHSCTPRELPWLMMRSEEEEEENPPPDVDACLFYSLSKQKIHTIPLPEMIGKGCCGSLQNGWLMIVDDKFDISLFHPWCKKKVDLPHRSNFKDDILEGGIFNNIRSAISSDAKVLVFLNGSGHLALCRIVNAAYTDICNGIDESMDDVIYHKGQFYAVSQVGAVYLLHIEEKGSGPRGEKLTLNLDSPVCYSQYRYLVPDILTDSMFVITRKVNSINQRDHQTIHFDIYRVDSLEQGSHDNKLKEFTKVESLGDLVVFLGYNYPMIVKASEFPGSRGNCIYFTDNIVDSFNDGPCRCDLGVFNLKDGTVEKLFADRFHPAVSPPLWIAAPPYSSQGDPLWIAAAPYSCQGDFGGESVMLGRTIA